jgi:glycosyltransferase involved in cell wall biosynthesis
MIASTTHVVVMPTYNTGPRLRDVVAEVLRHWQPVLVVVDGSTDGSEQAVLELARSEPGLRVQVLPRNGGKGAAVLAGARAAIERGFTHGLVMDADGQHPAASIAEFMTTSRQQPAALVLGRPIFPPNIPAERLHGRKLSIGLVHFLLLGSRIADPLFGFRVYPLALLLAVVGPRRGGRRYDFDTEAAVRLGWAGAPLVNLAAPVKYFSAAEGGVTHFHYVRDNATLVWMHTRLIAELLLWRWPAVRRQRSRWNRVALVVTLLLVGPTLTLRAAEPNPPPEAARRLDADGSGWTDLVAAFAQRADTTATFVERRHFPFRKQPVELAGMVRVSASRGLSLQYTSPEPRTIIVDDQGLLFREAKGEAIPPADPRARAAHEALLHVLRLDFSALARDFEIYGQREGASWSLRLVARNETVRKGTG